MKSAYQETLDPFTPQIDHQLIPRSGLTPLILFGLEVRPPETIDVILVIDLSDSFGDPSRAFSYIKKSLIQLPGEWNLKIFRLSSPEEISRPGLRLSDLRLPGDGFQHLCQEQIEYRSISRTGSFLRPVFESVGNLPSHPPKLMIIISDGQIGDFGKIDPPQATEIIGVIPNRQGKKSSRPIEKQMSFFELQDPKLDRAIAKYAHPYYGPVTIDLTLDQVDAEKIFRIDPDGRPIKWSSLPNHVFNFASGRQHVLADCAFEQSQSIRWEVKSCRNDAIRFLQGSRPAKFENEELHRRVIEQFNLSLDRIPNRLICWLSHSDPGFDRCNEQFKIARDLAANKEPWIDHANGLRVFLNFGETSLTYDNGLSKYQALLVLSVSSPVTNQPTHLAAFALRRDHNPAICFRPDADITGLTSEQTVEIKFDEGTHRWVLISSGGEILGRQANELEFYAAEKLPLPITHPDGIVTVLFSGNLA